MPPKNVAFDKHSTTPVGTKSAAASASGLPPVAKLGLVGCAAFAGAAYIYYDYYSREAEVERIMKEMEAAEKEGREYVHK